MISPPLLLSTVFSTLENFWNTQGISYEVFRYCETKIFQTEGCDIPLCNFFSIPEVSSYIELFEHNFLVLRDWKIERK